MKKSILFVAHIEKRGIESGHYLLDLRQIEIADSISYVAAFLLEGDEPGVLEQRDRDLFLLYVYY